MMRQMFCQVLLITLLMSLASPQPDAAAQPKSAAKGHKWVATWAASAHGPYPSGNASAQPVLDFAFESPERGAVDQTFRLIVKPDLWGRRFRLRFSNAFGAQSVTFDDVFVGVQSSGGNLVAGSNAPVSFEHGRKTLTLAPGATSFSDPVSLPLAARGEQRLLTGRKLAVSFHVGGPSGPMTWHAKALTTSYL